MPGATFVASLLRSQRDALGFVRSLPGVSEKKSLELEAWFLEDWT